MKLKMYDAIKKKYDKKYFIILFYFLGDSVLRKIFSKTYRIIFEVRESLSSQYISIFNFRLIEIFSLAILAILATFQ